MATVTKSIGTSSRNYSTVTLWEADLDNGAVYAAGDTALGEMYNDSVFVENVTLNGGTTIGLSNRILQGATGNRHTGVAGTGARITGSFNVSGTNVATYFKWIEQIGGSNGILFLFGSGSTIGEIWNCIGHGANSGAGAVQFQFSNFCTGKALNCIVYDVAVPDGPFNTRLAGGIVSTGSGSADEVLNCTVYNVRNLDVTGSGDANGIKATSQNVKNCVAMGTSVVSGTATDIIGTKTTCCTSDTSGTAGLTSKSAANQFVSTVTGSEDLHLKAGADCINAGTDLVVTPTGVNIDIDNRDRDATGDVWDIGADEYVSAGAYTLSSDVGAFLLAGQDAGLRASRLLTADLGTYALVGKDASLLYGHKQIADVVPYAFVGKDAGLLAVHKQVADVVTYALTGNDAGLLYGHKQVADIVTYALAGNDASFLAPKRVPGETGDFVLVGNTANLLYSKQFTADAGSYNFVGSTALFATTKLIQAAIGDYQLTGNDASLLRTRMFVADVGAYVYVGNDASPLVGYAAIAEAGEYIFVGRSANLVAVTFATEIAFGESGVEIAWPGPTNVEMMCVGISSVEKAKALVNSVQAFGTEVGIN